MSVDINAFIQESLAAGRGWESEEERQKYLERLEDEKFAIFAEDASEMTAEDIDAFNNMIYDNRTPLELMRNFREHGNRHFSTGKRNKMFYRDAVIMYGKALEQAQQLEDSYRTSDEGKEEISKLWSNAAAANLGLRNWGSALKAANAAVELWGGNVKAFYRKAKALIELKRYEQAVIATSSGLSLDPQNKDMEKLQKLARDKFRVARRQEEAKAADILRRQQPFVDLWELAQSCGALLGPPDAQISDVAGGHALGDARPRWSGHGDSRDIAWPILFLYPEYGQSDLVQEALGNDQLAEWLGQYPGDHLHRHRKFTIANLKTTGRVLPEEEEHLPDWDERREYSGSNVDVFFKVNAAYPIQDQEALLCAFGVSQRDQQDKTGGVQSPQVMSLESQSPLAKLNGLFNFQTPQAEPEEAQQAFVQVHPGCKVQSIATYPEHVLVGGILALSVVPRGTYAYKRFLDDAAEYTKGVVGMLQPTSS